jgi:hypothetical protein
VRGDAIGDTGERPHATRDNDHGIGGVRPAGYVRADIGVSLLLNCARGFADELANEVAASAQLQLFGHDAKRAVRGDEVHVSDTLVAFHGEKQMFEK